MRLDIKGAEEMDSAVSDRLVTKLADFLQEDQKKQLLDEVSKNTKSEQKTSGEPRKNSPFNKLTA